MRYILIGIMAVSALWSAVSLFQQRGRSNWAKWTLIFGCVFVGTAYYLYHQLPDVDYKLTGIWMIYSSWMVCYNLGASWLRRNAPQSDALRAQQEEEQAATEQSLFR